MAEPLTTDVNVHVHDGGPENCVQAGVDASSINDKLEAPVRNSARDFDKWMSQWNEIEGPPIDKQIEFAEQLCTENSDGSDVRPRQFSSGSKGERASRDEKIVSWKGVNVEWFRERFMALPEMKRFLEAGCRMWFVRNIGIKVLLQRRGIEAGCAADYMDFINATVTDHDATGSDDNERENQNQPLGPATAFVSYTGKYSLEHFVELLRNKALQGRFMWIDMLCVDQFAWTERKDTEMRRFKTDFMRQLQQKIGNIGYTTLLLGRWDDLMSTLQQIWVVWEVFATVEGSADLQVLLRPIEVERFLRNGLGRKGGVQWIRRSLSTINARDASAFNAEEKDLILSAMEEKGGVSNVNSTVIDRMRKWLVNVGEQLLEHFQSTGAYNNSWMVSNRFGLFREDLGQLEDSEACFRTALAILEEHLENDRSAMYVVMNNLANVVGRQGRHEEAEQMLRKILTYRRTDPKTSLQDTLLSVNNLGVLLMHKGEYDEAESLLGEALEGQESLLGRGHSDTLLTINNLGELYHRQKKHKESEEYHLEVLTAKRQNLEPRHPDTLVSLNNLAVAYFHQSRYEEAAPLYYEALAIQREQLGSFHPETLAFIGNIALLNRRLGRFKRAEMLFHEALNGFKRIHGETHASTLMTKTNLGVLYESTGNLSEAESLYRDVLRISREKYGNTHQDTIEAINNLGMLLARRKEYDLAEELYREALESEDCLPGSLHTKQNLALLLTDKGELELAEPLYREVLEARRQKLGNEHINTLDAIFNMARFEVMNLDWEKAIVLLKEAHEGYSRLVGSEDPKTKGAKTLLTRLFWLQRLGWASLLLGGAGVATLAVWMLRRRARN